MSFYSRDEADFFMPVITVTLFNPSNWYTVTQLGDRNSIMPVVVLSRATQGLPFKVTVTHNNTPVIPEGLGRGVTNSTPTFRQLCF